MKPSQLVSIEEGLDTIKHEVKYSNGVQEQLSGLSNEEQAEVVRDCYTDIRDMSEKLLDKYPDGKINLNKIYGFTLEVSDYSVSVYRDREFDNNGMYDQYATVFYVRDEERNPYVLLDAHETIDGFYQELIPAEER